MPTLSIIIPVYNVEKYLRQCLDSAVCPGGGDYEIVCVNDGSTDSSPRILREYEERYPGLIRVVTTENRGLGSASNTGIENARGSFIVFLDSDDYYAPGAVPEILGACREDTDLCIFDLQSVNDGGAPIGVNPGCRRAEGFFTLEEYPQLLFELPSRANKIFRRSLFAEHGISYPSRVWFEDYRTNPKLYTFCRKIRYIAKAWYCYRQQPDSITHGKNAERNLEIIDAAKDLLSWYRAAGLCDRYRNELEYSLYYNVVLTSTDRVNLIDPKSPVQEKLLAYYTGEFPDYQKNSYFRSMGKSYKLLHFLIAHRQYAALNALLRANNTVKGK